MNWTAQRPGDKHQAYRCDIRSFGPLPAGWGTGETGQGFCFGRMTMGQGTIQQAHS
jgi:hypothetical protein